MRIAMFNQTKEERLYRMFKDALDFHSDKFEEYTEAAAYYELTQDSLRSRLAKPWVYQINTPFATDAINLRVASLQSNDYSGELEPLSPEDIDDIDNLNKVYKEVWNSSKHNEIVSDAILQAAILGESYAHTIFISDHVEGGTKRKTKGKIETYLIDSASVHIDPKALHIKDADFIAISERITYNDVKRYYPNFSFPKPKSAYGDTTPQDRGEIYADGKYQDNFSNKEVFTKITIYEKNKKGYIDKTELLENKILTNTVEIPIRKFPISQMIWQKRLKSPYGTSLMAQLLPLQKVLNEIESANANANMQYSSPSYVISELSGIDPEAFAASAGAPAVVYEVSAGVDIDKAVRPLIPQRGIDEGLVITKQELERAIYKLAGINEAFQGTLGTSGNTATGADMTVERARMIEQRILINIEEFVDQLSGVIVEFITTGFEDRIIYAKGEKKTNGTWDFKSFKLPENAKDLEFNFFVELNVRTNYSKMQQNQTLMDMWQMENQYMAPNDIKAISTLDVLKTLNIPQQEEIVTRYENAVKMDAEQKAQMIAEMVAIAEELGLDPELLNAAIVEVITNQMETPSLDEFMQMADMARAQQEQQMNDMMSARENEMRVREEQAAEEQAMLQEQQMLDMEFNAEGGGTGENPDDMEFNAQ